MELLTEKELHSIYQQEKVKIINELWDRLSIDDKLVIIEMFKHLNPNLKIPINESKWYNTVLDWAGLIPGIGSAADLVNGFSYWRQGDKLFAILSWIGAIPLFGDVIATPIKSLLKVGGKGAQLFKTAVLAKDAVKIGETAKALGGPVAKMVAQAPSWGSKIITVLEKSIGKFPWLGKGLVDTVKEWVSLFIRAGKGVDVFAKMSRPAVSKLVSNTKFYMRFLDWLGLSNFKGSPKDLAKKVPNLNQKMMEYEKTLSDIPPPSEISPTLPPPPSIKTTPKNDPIGDLMGIFS